MSFIWHGVGILYTITSFQVNHLHVVSHVQMSAYLTVSAFVLQHRPVMPCQCHISLRLLLIRFVSLVAVVIYSGFWDISSSV